MTGVESERIKRAVAQAEAHTTGRIAVRIVPDESLDAFERARAEFAGANMHKNQTRNYALILLAPKAHRFAVFGDRALHEAVGDPFWKTLVREMEPYFARNAAGDGVVYAVNQLSLAMRTHFPAAESQ